jgi:hypothetical protein
MSGLPFSSIRQKADAANCRHCLPGVEAKNPNNIIVGARANFETRNEEKFSAHPERTNKLIKVF